MPQISDIWQWCEW